MSPKSPRQHEIDRKACGIFEAQVSDLVTVKHSDDYGIDYTIETCDSSEPPEVTGLTANVQVKGTSRLKVVGDVVSFSLEVDKLEYYLDSCRRPVFLCVVDVETEQIYWQFIQKYLLDDLPNQDWRQQKEKVIHLPIANTIADFDAFLDALEAADVRMRELWPGSPKAALASFQDIVSSQDPRLMIPSVRVSGDLTEYQVLAREDVPFRIRFEGPKDAVETAIDQFAGQGLDIDAEKLGIDVTATGLPEAIQGCGKITQIQQKKNIEGAIVLTITDVENRSSELTLHGSVQGGAHVTHLNAASQCGILEVHTSIDSEEPLHGPCDLQYTLLAHKWNGTPVWKLQDFDVLWRWIDLLKPNSSLVIEVFFDGNSVARSKPIPGSAADLIAMQAILQVVNDLRFIEKRTNFGIVFRDDFNDKALNDVAAARALLEGNSIGVTVDSFQVESVIPSSELDATTHRYSAGVPGLIAKYETFPVSFCKTIHDLGPVVLELESATLELVESTKNSDDSQNVMVTWKLSKPVQGRVRLDDHNDFLPD